MKKTAIIVAGGSGSRMQTAIPKQFLLLQNKPLLMHTLTVFVSYDPDITLILVIPPDQEYYWKELCKKYSFTINHQIVHGGNNRFESVKNGLNVTQEEGLVAIHDGVRPLVALQTIDRCFHTAATKGNAIPVIPPVDSVRQKLMDGSSIMLDRTKLVLIQTPQVFEAALIKRAYEQPFRTDFTDDASVLENTGIKIHLVQGNRENIKITSPHDLVVAEMLLELQQKTREQS
ncbi:MAG TPA: 2-C-methyl-D-erythritol 4-phosphate cytidylyltransferase [Bacteroidales bacterium]|nr:2-C-methyl-D-erythritol 4-phosphate cytidylyltransferase [Bacteroidales bacterium]